MTGVGSVPFVVGQWVRGARFYGRAAQIAEILDGPRNWIWLVGTRRLGKTSLLKQLEHLTTTEPERGFVPIFWDLQGAEDAGELHAALREALYDAEERFEEIGVDISDALTDHGDHNADPDTPPAQDCRTPPAAALRRGGGTDHRPSQRPRPVAPAAPHPAGA